MSKLSIVIIIAVNNNLLTKYGYETFASTGEAFGAVIPLAVVGIVMKVFGIVVSIVIGIRLGGQPIIGFNMGAGNMKRVKETILLITRLVLSVGTVAFLMFEIVPDAIILQSMGNSAKSTVLALLRDVIIFVPASIIIATISKNIVTMLWAAVISDVCAAIIGFIFVRTEIKKCERKFER